VLYADIAIPATFSYSAPAARRRVVRLSQIEILDDVIVGTAAFSSNPMVVDGQSWLPGAGIGHRAVRRMPFV